MPIFCQRRDCSPGKDPRERDRRGFVRDQAGHPLYRCGFKLERQTEPQQRGDEDRAAARRPCVENVAQYDYVFVGFPIWWYEAPRIVQTFLESYDFSGKTVIPFATSGGSGMGKTAAILQKSCPAAKVLPGIRMSGSASLNEVSSWVKSLGL